MSDSAGLFPNLGAEEGPGWRRSLALPKVRRTVGWWRTLFERGASVVGLDDEIPSLMPAPLEHDAGRAAFDFMDAPGALVPWLSTEEAAELARAHGLALACAPAEVVARVHDKAFALGVAERQGLLPSDLSGAIQVLEPELLRDVAGASRHLEAFRGRGFVLKPRFGSSGRGRVRVDGSELAGAFARLAARGGCLLEPWLERTQDLSAQLWIGPDAEIRLLGTLRQDLTPSGVWSAHSGEIDAQGGIRSGSAWDASVRDAALRLAGAARDVGFSGACGLDALAYRLPTGGEALRPVVEFNARFTVGTIAVGLVQRALRCAQIERGQRFRFTSETGLEVGSTGQGDGRGGTRCPISP